MARLTIKDERGKQWVHELVDSVTTIGRASTNVIQIADTKASRQHFRVEKADHGFKLVDLGSTNGTRVNGSRVQGELRLNSGEQISLGNTTFLFEDPDAPAPVPPAAAGADTQEIEPPAEPAEPKFILKVLEGQSAGKVYELGPEALTIGRHSSSTVQIHDEAASNYHAEINREPIGYVLTDLGSTNGTYVTVKNKNDFEKVVKAPLADGARIRIGKTVLEFLNVGRPIENELLFGTVALDPAELAHKLGERRRVRPLHVAAAAVSVVALTAVLAIMGPSVWQAAMRFFHSAPPTVNPTAPPPENLIANGDFKQGTDDEGNPRNFKRRGVPGVRVALAPAAHHPAPGDNGDKSGVGLLIGKTGVKSASTLTVVETADSFGVEPGKVYEFTAWMKADGDGLLGLQVEWRQGERSFYEHPVVLVGTQEWKRQSAQVTPPAWAQRAKVGAFAIGKEGEACFDQLVFKAKPDAEASTPPTVKAHAIAVAFDGTKGNFNATSQSLPMLEDGSLELLTPDHGAISELLDALGPRLAREGGRACYQGKLYDFAMQDLTDYMLKAEPGTLGVDLRVAVNTASNLASIPMARFYVTGPTALGEIQVAHAGGAMERVNATEDKTFPDVQELLFNAGKAQQFALFLNQKPLEVELKREGPRRRVTLTLKGEVQLSLAAESYLQHTALENLKAALQKALHDKRWGEVERAAAQLRAEFSSGGPDVEDLANKALLQRDGAWKPVEDDANKALNLLQNVPGQKAYDDAKDLITGYLGAWSDSEKAAWLKKQLERAGTLMNENQDAVTERDAAKQLKGAEDFAQKKIYTVAVVLLKKLINDPTTAKTKAGERARELLPKYEAANQRIEDLKGITIRLLEQSRNLETNKEYKAAADLIEKDKDYQDNKDDLPELTSRVADLRRKVQ